VSPFCLWLNKSRYTLLFAFTQNSLHHPHRDSATFPLAIRIAFCHSICHVVYVGKFARTMGVISKQNYFHLRPTNALIAKAVEVYEQRNVSQLVYAAYKYVGKPNSSLTEFKRRNGFEEVLCPRYFIPLTGKGSLIITLGLHLGLRRFVPTPLCQVLLRLRSWIYMSLELVRRSHGRRSGLEDRSSWHHTGA
jgi:hypothetical protein